MEAALGAFSPTLGLLNLNFDFSLLKFDAPSEYKGIGQSLSKKRRDAAESGSEHIVARKLGLLFTQSLPSTTRLISAYGTRATEIATLHEVSAQKSQDFGIFEDFAGADATSLWAAATSGPGVIAIHLLTCMLARHFPASEAVTIWEEIIESRRKELSNNNTADDLHISSLSARIEITREQIANWDASVRSWLQVADGAKALQQKRLGLLIQDTGLPVNSESGVYGSVIAAWKMAMVIVDKILGGEPHSIQDGAVLLGLASWHLYPDLCLIGSSRERTAFKDPLVSSGGIVTLGISKCSPDAENGVYWSLPLAYLRFYGDPVPTTRTIGEGSTRLSLSEFFLVVLGTVISSWGKHSDDTGAACKFIMALWDFFDCHRLKQVHNSRPWLQHLAEAASTYLSASDIQRDYFESLISRGRRRHRDFLANPAEHPSPMFGISNVSSLLSLVSGADKKVAVLRILARHLNASPESRLLIRYRRPKQISDLSDTISDEAGVERPLK